MRVGTKSILFGAHAFWFHPFAVALAWWELYRWAPAIEGGRWPAVIDPRAWVVFFLHDIGYLGLSNMDGDEGEAHPEASAIILSILFDGRLGWRLWRRRRMILKQFTGPVTALHLFLGPWGLFSLLHSRHYARDAKRNPSRLCAADKLALMYTPWWLYIPGTTLSGEIVEYMNHARELGHQVGIAYHTKRDWYETMRAYCARWARRHADGSVDTWTGDRRSGVADTPDECDE